MFQSTTVSIKMVRRVPLESTGVARSNGGGIWKDNRSLYSTYMMFVFLRMGNKP